MNKDIGELLDVEDLDAVAGGCRSRCSGQGGNRDLMKMLLTQLMFGPNGLFKKNDGTNRRR